MGRVLIPTCSSDKHQARIVRRDCDDMPENYRYDTYVNML